MGKEEEVSITRSVPEYLRSEPVGRCSKCKRACFSRKEFGITCGFMQPDKSRCDGIFESIQQIEVKPARFWESFGFKIVVGVVRQQVGFEVHEKPGKVIGQCLGLRNDGQTFFSNVDLPWVWPENYDWRPVARKRLDTFLEAQCRCEASGAEVMVCPYHERMNSAWRREDGSTAQNNKASEQQLDRMPLTGETPGPMAPLRLLNFDFPFIRMDVTKNQWVCLICHARETAYMNLMMSQNEFVLEHSRCMEESRSKMDAKVKPDARTIAFREMIDIASRARTVDEIHAALRRHLGLGAEPKRYIEGDPYSEMERLIDSAEEKALPETTSGAKVANEVDNWTP